MNIIEAVKSGKRYRRPDKEWRPDKHEKAWHIHSFSVEELLADDWEIQEQKVTITEGEFEKAYAVARSMCGGAPFRGTLKKELGFE